MQIPGPCLPGSELVGSGVEPGTCIFKEQPAEETDASVSTHLGDLAPTEVGETLEGEGQDVGGPVDGEALAGRHLLLASEEGRGCQLLLEELSLRRLHCSDRPA